MICNFKDLVNVRRRKLVDKVNLKMATKAVKFVSPGVQVD